MRTIRAIIPFAAVCAAACAFAEGDALLTLLNSRAADDAKTYAEAAASVRRAADAGDLLPRYAVAVLSADPRAPEALRMEEAARAKALAETRDRVRRQAEGDILRHGDPLAWYLLSLEKDDVRFLKRAADGGNVQAMNAWGTLKVTDALRNAADSNRCARVLSEAHSLFERAARANDANGLYNLAMCRLKGYGCARDEDLAFNGFRKAADLGHPEAINNIGGFYRDGICVMRNPLEAAKWFRRSAEMRNGYGMLNYALALQRAEGVDRDEKRAAELLSQSARGGCLEACVAYGMCLYLGRGTGQDRRAAVAWFRRAAAQGSAQAMENLATCYALGHGVRQDYTLSSVWKIRARAAGGDLNARAWLQQNGYAPR